MGFLAEHGLGTPDIVEKNSENAEQFWVEVSHVRKHDLHLEVLSDVSRYLLPEVIELETAGKQPTATLATACSATDWVQSKAKATLVTESSGSPQMRPTAPSCRTSALTARFPRSRWIRQLA